MGHRTRYLPLLLALVVTLLVASPALAYVGPGAGMEFIGYAMSLLAMVGLALMSFLTWPAYALVRWVRGTNQQDSPPPPSRSPEG